MTTVGWIGLGAMGAPMATCVARAGYTRRRSTSTRRRLSHSHPTA